jgi:hypothetical protein
MLQIKGIAISYHANAILGFLLPKTFKSFGFEIFWSWPNQRTLIMYNVSTMWLNDNIKLDIKFNAHSTFSENLHQIRSRSKYFKTKWFKSLWEQETWSIWQTKYYKAVDKDTCAIHVSSRIKEDLFSIFGSNSKWPQNRFMIVQDFTLR